MDISFMRYRIANAPKYANTVKWRNKVENMPDNQVIAIYYKFVKMGLFEPQKGIRKPQYTQITLYDIFPEVMSNGIKRV